MKKIKDTERLDWLQKNHEKGIAPSIGFYLEEKKDLRQAIDAEIRKSRGKKS